MRELLIVAASVMLAGCATSIHYVKAGGTEEERERTLAGCKVKAAMVPDAGAFTGPIAANTRDNCMRAEGWKREP